MTKEKTGKDKPEDKPKPHYELDELLAKITPENMHPEISIGPPVGDELL